MKRGLTILHTVTIGKVHNGVRNIKFTFSVLYFCVNVFRFILYNLK